MSADLHVSSYIDSFPYGWQPSPLPPRHVGHKADPPNLRFASESRLSWTERHASFDQLVSTQKERLGDFQPKRLGGLEVDDKIEFRR